ncbi:MAG: hypothetical protein HY329_13265, partial [Chloroflexi bacterium]|nr:hypothetical protein [Chloroflexota bacterium]
VLDRLAVLDVLFARVGTVHAEEALELYTRLGDWLRAGRMHRLLGMTFTTGLAGVADMERAHYHNESALRLFEAASDSRQKALIYSAVASSLLFGRLDTAGGFRHARQALTIAEQLGDPDQITHACIYLAAAAIHSGDTDQAEALAERSWAAAQEGRDPWGKVAAAYYPVLNWPWLNDRAWLARWRERYLARRQSSHVEFFDLPSLGPSALELALLGRPRDALAELQIAAESGVQRPSFVSYLRYYAAAAHAIIGNWEQAQSLFRQSLDAVETGHYLAMRAEVGAFYGQALLAEGDLLAAEELLTSAYSVAQERGSLIQELRLLPLLVDLHLDQQHRAQAEAALTRAWEILERSRHWYGLEAAVHRAAGRLELARANWAEAGYAFERALELEHARGFPYQEAHILVHWAELYRQRHEPGDAARRQELLDQALAIFERCEAKADIERVRALRAAFVDQ